MLSVFIAHGSSANYPEVEAYSRFLSDHGLSVSHGPLETARRHGEPDVVWCLMGFFPRLSFKRSVVIHDYRSLSVGRLARIKDLLKRRLQRAPDLRIFQNETMRAMMDFTDEVPHLLLPMGVPDQLLSQPKDISPHAVEEKNTFAYIGAMTRERQFDRLLSVFLESSYARSHRLVLIGDPEPAINRRFADQPSLVFTGRLAHDAALDRVRQAAFAVSYFPYHRPHRFQTPTKLIEYAALGSKIICNDSPSNLRTIREYGLPCAVTGPMIFDDLSPQQLDSLGPASPDSVRSATWNGVLSESGIVEEIERLTAR